MKFLNIGPLYQKNDTTQVGGIVVLFENWKKFCEDQNIQNIVIDSNKFNYKNKLLAFILIIKQIVTNTKKVDALFLHGTYNDYLFIAPFATLIAKVFNKKLFLRKFAGDFDIEYNKCGVVKKSILKYSLKRANILFWETKNLVEFGKKINSNSFWFPNVRYQNEVKTEYVYKKRFVFISQVRKEKGIDTLINCFKQLDNTYQIDIYGPIFEYKESDLNGTNYSYKGVLKPNEVSQTLCKYDCLILPSYREGYPGIVIEAFASGVPVIVTNVGGMPEMIEHGKNGFILMQNNPKVLKDAIENMSKSDFEEISRNASKSFDNYNAEKSKQKNNQFNTTIICQIPLVLKKIYITTVLFLYKISYAL